MKMKKNNKKPNKQNKRNTNQFKKSIKMKNQKMKNQSNDNYNSYQEEYNSQKPKSKIGMELSNLLDEYSKNRFKDGYSLVKSLSIDGGLKTVIGFKKEGVTNLTKFNLDDYEDETIGLSYDIVSIDSNKKVITTSITKDKESTTKFMEKEFSSKDVNPRYLEWIDNLSEQMGEYLINVFDDYTVETQDLLRVDIGIVKMGYLEPKNKSGFRMFPVNYQN